MLFFYALLLTFLTYSVVAAAPMWPEHPFVAGGIGAGVFTVMMAWQFLYRANQHRADHSWFRAIARLGSIAMGFWATFILLSLPLAFLRLLFLAGDRLWPAAAETRHLLVTGPALDLAIAAVSAVLVFFGYREARRGPRVRRIAVGVRGLPADLEGFTVVQLSDLHIGPTLRRSFVESVVRETNAERPDLIAVTGDIADADASILAEQLAPLKSLSARFGAFMVTGNHEYYWDTPGLLALAERLGLRPLINENQTITVGASTMLVSGVTDPMGASFDPAHAPDVARAARSTRPADFRLLLAHRPNIADAAETAGFDLQLSGHTHGGQFFPFNLLVPLVHRFPRGLHRQGRLAVHVNPGTGFWGPEDRLGVSSEITVLRLTGLAETSQN